MRARAVRVCGFNTLSTATTFAVYVRASDEGAMTVTGCPACTRSISYS
jgi:hypothetical protein